MKTFTKKEHKVIENLHLLSDIENALNAVKLMTSDKVKATNLTESLQDLNIHLKPEDQQLLEEILDVDGKYNHCQPVCLNNVALLTPVTKFRIIHLFV